MDTCQNCNSKLKVGVLGTNQLLNEGAVKIINSLDDQNAECYCNKCGDKLLTNATDQLKSKIGKLNEGLLLLSQHIPILSTHSPLNWDYDSIGIITGQSTTGTGVISDFTSGITDFFGAQSGAYNKKLAEGENKCFDQLRMKALASNGNAIIAVDIDYAEVGSGSGMLMVCMTGTAIKLKNIKILGSDKNKYLNEIDGAVDEIKEYDGLLNRGRA